MQKRRTNIGMLPAIDIEPKGTTVYIRPAVKPKIESLLRAARKATGHNMSASRLVEAFVDQAYAQLPESER